MIRHLIPTLKRIQAVIGLLLSIWCTPASPAERPYDSVGPGRAVVQGSDLGGCGTLNLNTDGSYENGYAWQYGGVVAPSYGAFAECYNAGSVDICSVTLDLTQIGGYYGQLIDIYVWNDAGGAPGAVRCIKTGVAPGAPAYWPSISRHVVPLSGCCTDASFWVGYWGNWPSASAPFYIGADLDGWGGCPYTNIAPGIGFPTGWNNVSVAWGPTQALGIGCETRPYNQMSGACCFYEECECLVLTQQDCLGQGGTYMGDGVPCEPTPCCESSLARAWPSSAASAPMEPIPSAISPPSDRSAFWVALLELLTGKEFLMALGFFAADQGINAVTSPPSVPYVKVTRNASVSPDPNTINQVRVGDELDYQFAFELGLGNDFDDLSARLHMQVIQTPGGPTDYHAHWTEENLPFPEGEAREISFDRGNDAGHRLMFEAEDAGTTDLRTTILLRVKYRNWTGHVVKTSKAQTGTLPVIVKDPYELHIIPENPQPTFHSPGDGPTQVAYDLQLKKYSTKDATLDVGQVRDPDSGVTSQCTNVEVKATSFAARPVDKLIIDNHLQGHSKAHCSLHGNADYRVNYLGQIRIPANRFRKRSSDYVFRKDDAINQVCKFPCPDQGPLKLPGIVTVPDNSCPGEFLVGGRGTGVEWVQANGFFADDLGEVIDSSWGVSATFRDDFGHSVIVYPAGDGSFSFADSLGPELSLLVDGGTYFTTSDTLHVRRDEVAGEEPFRVPLINRTSPMVTGRLVDGQGSGLQGEVVWGEGTSKACDTCFPGSLTVAGEGSFSIAPSPIRVIARDHPSSAYMSAFIDAPTGQSFDRSVETISIQFGDQESVDLGDITFVRQPPTGPTATIQGQFVQTDSRTGETRPVAGLQLAAVATVSGVVLSNTTSDVEGRINWTVPTEVEFQIESSNGPELGIAQMPSTDYVLYHDVSLGDDGSGVHTLPRSKPEHVYYRPVGDGIRVWGITSPSASRVAVFAGTNVTQEFDAEAGFFDGVIPQFPADSTVLAIEKVAGYWGRSRQGVREDVVFGVVSVNPPPSENEADRRPNVQIDFSRALVDSALSPADLHGRSVIEGTLNGTLETDVSGTAVTFSPSFSPSSQLRAGDIVEMALRGAVRSAEGDRLPGPVVYRFRVKSTPGASAFATLPLLIAGAKAVETIAADLNRDGRIDVVAAGSDGDLAIFINTTAVDATAPSFQRTHVPQLGQDLTGVAAVDLDEDGDLDLLLSDQGSDLIRIGRNSGDGTTYTWTSFPTGDAPQRIQSGELNGDGHVDFVYTCRASGELRVHFGDGQIGPGVMVVYPLAADPMDVAINDLELDFDLDIVVLHETTQQITVLRNQSPSADPNAVFSIDSEIAIPPTLGFALEDWNGDRLPDIALATNQQASVAILVNQADGTFGAPTFHPTGGAQGTDLWGLAPLDHDGDGDLDIVTTNWDEARCTLLINDGGGAFSAVTSWATEWHPRHPLAVDLDGNGTVDVAIPSAWTEKISLHLADLNPSDVPDPQSSDGLRFRGEPNPFQDGLTFTIPGRGAARLEVFDVAGRLVRKLELSEGAMDVRQVRWDGRDEAGRATPAGLYHARLIRNGSIRTTNVIRLQ